MKFIRYADDISCSRLLLYTKIASGESKPLYNLTMPFSKGTTFYRHNDSTTVPCPYVTNILLLANHRC